MAEHDHAHGSTTFDYPGFHISCQTVQQSCVARSPGYATAELTKETPASARALSRVVASSHVQRRNYQPLLHAGGGTRTPDTRIMMGWQRYTVIQED